ncbi:MAG: glycosyltransferase family 4 protein [Chloroflexi bacterium]|nr:glycosyltransferase family 4 protein [Chloroflexota bacterium]
MSRPLKILIVDHAPIFGGVEAMIRDLVGAADSGAFALTLVTDNASPVQFNWPDARRVPLPRLRRNPAAMFWAGAGLARLARTADVLMTTTARAHAIGSVAASLSQTPLIWRLADDTLPPALARAFAPIPKRIVAVSAFIAGRCSPQPAKTVIIPDGLPNPGLTPPGMRQSARAALGLRPDERVALSVARLVRWKGHTLFARAVKLSGVTGLIAGGEDESEGELGGKGLREELETMCGVSGRSNERPYRLLGHRADLREVFAACDVFAHTSTRPEPFGRAVVQAMMAGIPVAASHSGAIAEVVGEAGRLFPSGDAVGLAAALAMDERTRVRLGREGRERALARFELGAMTRRLEEVWRDAAGV